MALPLVIVDAFADAPFRGNPAAVCLLDSWRPDQWLQNVAAEMNLSETAFLLRRGAGEWELRWFTPTVEVDLLDPRSTVHRVPGTDRHDPTVADEHVDRARSADEPRVREQDSLDRRSVHVAIEPLVGSVRARCGGRPGRHRSIMGA